MSLTSVKIRENTKMQSLMLATPWKLLEFWNFFQSSGKRLEKPIFSLYSWKTPEIFGKIFISFVNKSKLQKHLTHDRTFCILCKLNFSYCYCSRTTWYQFFILIMSQYHEFGPFSGLLQWSQIFSIISKPFDSTTWIVLL